MGCLQSTRGERGSSKIEEDDAPKQYSWDNRPKIDPKDYMIENLKGVTAGRMPGKIDGQQFIIQNCQDCNIYLYDYINTITIDDCTNCNMFIGPVKTSVFIRDCTDCNLLVACQQFRTRDCKKMNIFISCVSQPIIEASTGMKFGCFTYYYPELEEQFRSANISIYNNTWSKIHDFTPVPGENNFTFHDQNVKMEEFIPLPKDGEFATVEVSVDPEKSVVPRTLGNGRKPSNESCLVVFFYDGGSHRRAERFITEMKCNHSGCVLVQSKELTMQPSDAQRVFNTDSYAMVVKAGQVIGFEYNGDECCRHCQETVIEVTQGSTGLVYVSTSPTSATQQIENFYNFADMQMNA